MNTRLAYVLTFCLLICGCDVAPEQPKDPPVLATGIAFSETDAELQSDELFLPRKSSPKPWDFGVSKVNPSKRVRLDHLLPKKFDILGSVVAQNAGRLVLTYRDRTERESKSTFVVLCDIRNGTVLGHWPVGNYLAPYSIHPEATQVIFCRCDAVRSRRETLYVARLRPDAQFLELKTWRPLVSFLDSDSGEPKLYVKEWEIMWAEFVGDCVVTLNNSGTLHLWNRHDLKRIAMVSDVVGMPSLTPDRSKVVFVKGDAIAMLDPMVPAITHAKRIGQAPEQPAIAIQPSGKRIAIGGTGKAIVLDVDRMKQTTAMIDRLKTQPGMALRPNFHWIGDFLCTYKDLYNFETPIPVWKFRCGSSHDIHDGQVWSVVRDRGNRSLIYLRGFDLPTHEIEKHVKQFFESSDIVALRRGEHVDIDVSKIPQELQAKTKTDLKGILTKAGFGVSPRANVRLVASLDEPKRTDVEYHEWASRSDEWKFVCDIRKARLEFVRGDDVLWTRTAYEFPPMSIALENMPKTRFVEHWGNPDLTLFSEGKLPTYVLGTDRWDRRGETVLTADGVKTYPARN